METKTEVKTPDSTTLPLQITTPVVNIINTTNDPIIIRVWNVINLTADAVAFEKALSGYGADVFTVIYLVSTRSNAERQQIRQQYRYLFNQVNMIYKYEIQNTTVLVGRELHDTIV